MVQALKWNILPGRHLSISGSDSPSCHYTWWTVNNWLLCCCLLHLKAISLPLQIMLRCCYWCTDSLYEKSRVWGCKSPLNVLYSFQSVPYLWNTNLEISCVQMFCSVWELHRLMLLAGAASQRISPRADLQQVIMLMEAGYSQDLDRG